ncbi:MAG: acyltransferase family protein [Acidobacteriota bacterium]|nr:acyltransferase family protein [Acidobacteriota bacterium]
MNKVRMHELDWLRIIAIVILLFFHVAMIYNLSDWHINNPERSLVIDQFTMWSHYWRMPLLFFISGAGTCFALRYRTRKRYASERTRRLLIPLLCTIPIVIPVQVYIEKIAQYDSFISFLPQFFTNGVYPEGNFSWHHLWFVVYLYIYSLICIPLFFYWRGEGGKKWNDRLIPFFQKRGYLMFLVLPIILSQALLRPIWPDQTHALYNDWAWFTYYGLFFVFGYIICTDNRYWKIILDQRRTFLYWTLAATALRFFSYHVIYHYRDVIWIRYDHLRDLTGMCVAWFTVLAVLGYGRRYLAFSNKYLPWANESVYPFYIWHQAVIIVIGYVVLQWGWGITTGFIFISVASFAVSIGLTMLVRQTNLTRRMFGMKPVAKAAPQANAGVPAADSLART